MNHEEKGGRLKNVYNATFTDAETHRNANCSLLPWLSVQNIMATCLTGMHVTNILYITPLVIKLVSIFLPDKKGR